MAQKILQQSREAESALADALVSLDILSVTAVFKFVETEVNFDEA
jgi:hypothetical protein